MKIFFCDLCNESVPQGDLDEGRAFLRKGRVVCATCDRLMSAQEAEQAQQSGAAGGPFDGGAGGTGAAGDPGGGTATLTKPAAATAPAAAIAVQRELMRSDAAQRSGSTGAWLAIVTLVFAAAAFALLVERITALETSMQEEDRALAGDVRQVTEELDATVAGVGSQSRDLELRVADRLEEARQHTDGLVRELSAELGNARLELTRQSETIARLTTELAEARADGVRRHDDTNGRVARAEEDLRYYAQRLSDLEMASLRPIAAGAAPGEPAGAPAWQGLIADLASPLAGTRWQAVDALGETNDLAVVEHLIPVLRDPDVFVRMAGARALMKLGAIDATPHLIDALEDPEAAVREAAFVALNELTGRDFKFDPLGSDADRAKRVKAWRDWWEKEGSAGE